MSRDDEYALSVDYNPSAIFYKWSARAWYNPYSFLHPEADFRIWGFSESSVEKRARKKMEKYLRRQREAREKSTHKRVKVTGDE